MSGAALEDLLQQLLERSERRYFGKYRGYVHDVDDPRRMGRIRAVVPRLLGDTPTPWALPCTPYAGPDQGLFTVPDAGSGCWIEFEEGDINRPIWSGMWWGAPQQEDVDRSDSSARVAVDPPGSHEDGDPESYPEVPRHNYPSDIARPGVRMLKSSTGHHIVLDDRPEHERIEIHDSRGNRMILSRNGLETLVSNMRTVDRGNRAAKVYGLDDLKVGKQQQEFVGQWHSRSVGSWQTLKTGGAQRQEIGGIYKREVGHHHDFPTDMDPNGSVGVAEEIDGSRSVKIEGADERQVGGAARDVIGRGYGLGAGGSVKITSGGAFKVGAAAPDMPGLPYSIDLMAATGNVSINTALGFGQFGGITALSPMVTGDGLMVHLTILAQILKMVNPLTVGAYGPLLDTWVSLTPLLDLSYFGYVKRLPVG